MATINGELSALGPGSGAAVVLKNDNTALSLLASGQRARDLRAQREAAIRQKRDAELAKEFNDRLQYKTSGDPYYGQALQDRVYSGVEKQLSDIYGNPNLSSFEKTRQSALVKQNVENQGVRATADAKSYDDLLEGFRAKPELYNSDYAGTYLANKLHTADGKRALPNEVDALGIQRELTADANLYNEKGWIDEAAKAHNLFPERSEKYATAGVLGGVHTLNEAKVRLVKTDGQGRAIMNADGTPALDIKDADITALKSIPQVKLLLDKRIADYEKSREKDPSLPKMSEKGHIAQMVSRLATYDQSRTSGLNAQVPRTPASAGKGAKYTTTDPNAGGYATYGIKTAHDKGSIAGSATIFQGLSPQKKSETTGKLEPRTRDNALFDQVIVQRPGEGAELVKNNTKAQNLQFEGIMHILRTPTGNIIRPTQAADTKDQAAYEAWYQRAKAENPKAKGDWVVQATPKKGEDGLSSEEDVYEQLAEANDRVRPGKGTAKKTEPELRAAARKLVGDQNAVYYIPYTEANARKLNAYTDNFYEQGRANREKIAADFDARTKPRATGPASLLQPGAVPPQNNAPASGANRFRKNR